MTATPRYLTDPAKSRADDMGMEVASMDDHELFGPVFHELKFSEAIRRNLLTDYTVVIIGVDDPIYRRYAEEGVFVTLSGKRITDAPAHWPATSPLVRQPSSSICAASSPSTGVCPAPKNLPASSLTSLIGCPRRRDHPASSGPN